MALEPSQQKDFAMQIYLSTIDLEFVVSHLYPGGHWCSRDDVREYRRPSGLLLTWHAAEQELEVHAKDEVAVMLMQIKLNKAALDWRRDGFAAFQIINRNENKSRRKSSWKEGNPHSRPTRPRSPAGGRNHH
jgi:hypothetical protein